MKTPTLICFALFLLGVALWLVELWFEPWRADLFFKIIMTNAIFFAVAVVWAFLLKERKETDKIHGEKSSLD